MWWPKENQLQNIVLNQERTHRKFKGRMADKTFFHADTQMLNASQKGENFFQREHERKSTWDQKKDSIHQNRKAIFSLFEKSVAQTALLISIPSGNDPNPTTR